MAGATAEESLAKAQQLYKTATSPTKAAAPAPSEAAGSAPVAKGPVAPVPAAKGPVPEGSAEWDKQRELAFATKTLGNAAFKSAVEAEGKAKALELGPEGEPKNAEAKRAEAEADYTKAVALYTEAIEFYPGTGPELAPFYTNRALVFKRQNRHTNVIEDCSLALALSPVDAIKVKAFNYRCQARKASGDWHGTLHDHLVLMTIHPDRKKQEKLNSATLDEIMFYIGGAAADQIKASTAPVLPDRSALLPFLDGFSDESAPEPESVRSLTKKIKANDTDGCLYLRRAKANLQAANFEAVFGDAIEAVTRLKATEAGDSARLLLVDALTLKGTFHHLLGQLDESIDSFDEALAIDATCVEALVKRGIAYFEKRTEADVTSALKDMEAAVALAPNSPSVHYHRGQLNLLQQKITMACADFKKSIDLGHTGYSPYLQIGRAKTAQNDVPAAMKMYDAAVAKFPSESNVLTYKGQILCHPAAQNIEDAMKAFDHALAMDPSNPLPLTNKADVYFKQGKPETIKMAFDCLKEAVKIDPKHTPARQLMAQAYMQTKQFGLAVEQFDEVVKCLTSKQELVMACSFREMCKMQLQLSEEGFKLAF